MIHIDLDLDLVRARRLVLILRDTRRQLDALATLRHTTFEEREVLMLESEIIKSAIVDIDHGIDQAVLAEQDHHQEETT